ncbi:MAG: hypothetical protein ACYC06_07350 [Ilumatobacteraceae bacterium]
MKWRRPGDSTIGALVIFLVSFGVWLTQPQPDEPVRTVLYPGVDFVFVTTTTTTPLPPVDTVPQTTVVNTTTIPPETLPPVDTTVPPVEPETTTTVAG